jgi:arginyl-tRNA synthetase
MKENDKLYNRMDIKVFPFGESYYNKMLAPTVEECKQKGLVKLDEGA